MGCPAVELRAHPGGMNKVIRQTTGPPGWRIWTKSRSSVKSHEYDVFILHKQVNPANPRPDDPYRGEVAEWSNAAVSKTVVGLRRPRVRIPVSPPGPI
ncbi:MAG: hypothetical protein JWQ22_732 [Devosia sp.]|nr:hypothetical protein [Devosia sp.]